MFLCRKCMRCWRRDGMLKGHLSKGRTLTHLCLTSHRVPCSSDMPQNLSQTWTEASPFKELMAAEATLINTFEMLEWWKFVPNKRSCKFCKFVEIGGKGIFPYSDRDESLNWSWYVLLYTVWLLIHLCSPYVLSALLILFLFQTVMITCWFGFLALLLMTTQNKKKTRIKKTSNNLQINMKKGFLNSSSPRQSLDKIIFLYIYTVHIKIIQCC